MASGTFNRTIISDNDQSITILLNIHEHNVATNTSEILVHHTTDCSNFDPYVTDQSSQVELALTEIIYSFQDYDNSNKAEFTICYEVAGTSPPLTLLSIPCNVGSISFNKGIGKNATSNSTADFTGNVLFNTHAKNITGYALLTFYKKHGFLNNHPKYRKATQKNPYPNY